MLLLLLACAPPPLGDSAVPLDLTAPLGASASRAGVVTDPTALFGGVSSEGRPGDVKIYNDRVQFIVQQPGDSSFYIEYGGGIIDADIVRPAGVPGRDLVDDMAVMVGLGRVVDVDTVTVVDDGSTGPAHVRTEGRTAPMHLVTGSLESDDIVPELQLRVVTDYVLEPGAWSMQVTSTVTSEEAEAQTLAIGDLGLVSLDVGDVYVPGNGLGGPGVTPLDWTAVLGWHNEVTFGLFGDADPLEQGAIGQILGSLVQSVAGFGPTESLAPGGSMTWTRWVGVAPDPATLTGEQLARRGAPARAVTGRVVDDRGSAVPGARVHLLDATGAPVTVAFADANGAWAASVPDSVTQALATGRGHALAIDLPAGHGWLSPYDVQADLTLASIRDGAPATPFAEGCGVGTPTALGADPLPLPGCGSVRVHVADNGPAVVHLYPADGVDPVAVDGRLVPGRPSGAMAMGFVRDGEAVIPVEPGTYTAVVSRGVRDELWHGTVSVASGGESDVEAAILPAYTLPGVVTGDPHSHAAPSGDGGIPMEDRLLVTAANGVDVHFGTDHDHVADYRPLLAPMGLEGRLRSVVADEVSPVLRGHFNAWPAHLGEGANHGAPRWWFGYADTAEIFGWMRALVGPSGVVQANHPVGSSGMFSFADYDPEAGVIGAPDHWSDDFDAMEVLNSGDWQEYLPYYLDLVRRGKRVTPVGVSDSHTHTSGGVGLCQTFFLAGTDLAGFDDTALETTMRLGKTVVSEGPYVDVRVGDTQAPGETFHGGRLVARARVYAPSWMPVERVQWWVDGEVVATTACDTSGPVWCDAEQLLTLDADASVVVTADAPTLPMSWNHPGDHAWAMAAAFYVDADGDGAWTPPYPPLYAAK